MADHLNAVRISGPDDGRVAEYRGLTDAALMRTRGLFVAEGRLLVQRLIEDGRYTLRSVLLSDAAYRGLEATLTALDAAAPIYLCEESDFLGLTGHDIHRGCLALAERPPERTVRDLLMDAAGTFATLVLLEGVTNADNVGGVFRNAAAFGAGAVLLSPTCCDPLYRKAIRTSMAATLGLPFARVDPWPGGLEAIRAAGFTIVALSPRESALSIDGFAVAPRPGRVALVVGTEGEGLTPAVEAAADVHVRIPIAPGVDSLNLAVAVGIALYRLSPRTG